MADYTTARAESPREHGSDAQKFHASNGSASKRKQASAEATATRGQSTKRTKMTAALNTPRHRSLQVATGRDGDGDGPSIVPIDGSDILSNLRSQYGQEREEQQRTMDRLRKELEDTKQKAADEQKNFKFKLNDMVAQKTAAAEKRVFEAEEQLKHIAQKAKEDIVAIRANLVAAATDVVGPPEQTGQALEVSRTDAESVLEKLKQKDPKRYSSLIKAQPDYVKLATQLKKANASAGKQGRNGSEGINAMEAGKSPSPYGSTFSSAVARDAFQTLETALMDASDEMRTNSSLANQKKTLCKKMNKALQAAAPALLAPKVSVTNGASTNGQSTPIKPEIPQARTPAVDASALKKKNLQLQSMVNDLQFKLRDVREKLEEEVTMRKKIETEMKGN